MVMTPAKAHRMRVEAQQQSQHAAEGKPSRATANQYELMLVQLHEHKKQLKAIQSLTKKIDLKRQLMPDYGPYLDGILAADNGQQDEVLMTLLVWAIDTGTWHVAIELAAYALRHGLAMPDNYKRTTACLIAEEAADNAIKEIRAEQPFEADTLQRIMLLTAEHDMPDEVRAKLHKALGYALEKEDPEQALIELNHALELHDKAGVKKDIERIQRAIKHKAPSGPQEPGIA